MGRQPRRVADPAVVEQAMRMMQKPMVMQQLRVMMQDPSVKVRMQAMLERLGADSGLDDTAQLASDPEALDRLFERMQVRRQVLLSSWVTGSIHAQLHDPSAATFLSRGSGGA